MSQRAANSEDRQRNPPVFAMSGFSTANRMFFLSLPGYGEDALLVEEMQGDESVSALFQFRLSLLSYDPEIDPEKIVGKGGVLRIETQDDERHWNGYVSRFSHTGIVRASDSGHQDLYGYECDLVPWFWFLTQHEDCRIFQGKSVPDIIETIFAEFHYSDYRLELDGQYPPLDYCTQYNETSFAFISRLLEREGIHYYFRHDDHDESRHLLVLTDNKHGNRQMRPDSLVFRSDAQANEIDAVLEIACDRQMRTRKATLADWDYLKVSVLSEETPSVLKLGTDIELERYRYPGGFDTQGATPAGSHLADIVMEVEESSHLRYRGRSNVRTLTPGHVFTLEDHPQDEFNREFLVLSVHHHGHNNLLRDGGEARYENRFTLQPHTSVYRAPQSTPRAQARGPQTAIVVGPAGNEVYTDAHGRIKVRFHWDRKVPGRSTNTQDDKASCWIRVAQLWAGNGYGTMFVPRVGMEVVVDFLEGDPDRPLVVGCVYNGKAVPPLNLPDEATRSTIKTLSSKGGGGFNELRFEDKKGSEEIFLHAQKDLQLRTGNNRTEAIAAHSSLSVGKNRLESIGENADLTIGKNQTLSIGSNRAQTIGQDDYLTVGTAQHTSVGTDMAVTTGTNFEVNAGVNAALTTGVNIDLKAGVNLVAEAGAMISLKAGSSSIVLGPAGIFITGSMVMINSGGSALSAQKAKKAEKADKPKAPEEAAKSSAGKVNDPTQQLQAKALRSAARQGQPFCAECEAARRALAALRGG
ncbi:type VI secretion system secreted protein VgrG [Thermomonas haemolytica]|uniref:Type VI secretion system secreted protein VgrG n=2 Tax=Thermomonas haemolytica TaxID=141949 RepID=A0A4R3NBB1_9GAMM|nr:type VI secretion system secreted protein VgrG [Thermomonas haemolytica]TNY29032.1 hypothetical protein BV505_07355 [Thermomonas haemolytica]